MKNKEKELEREYIGSEKILQDTGWVYKGCGYWIDPSATLRYLTEVAVRIQKQRNEQHKSSAQKKI